MSEVTSFSFWYFLMSYEPSLYFSITQPSRLRYPAIGLHIDRVDPSASEDYTYKLAHIRVSNRTDERMMKDGACILL